MSESSDPKSTTPVRTPGEPYCGHCGYSLKGLENSSRCPECGKPLIEVLMREEFGPKYGKRYRSKATLFGLPVIDIAIGPSGRERRGKARGIIAIGDIATGWLAVGGICFGIVAIGGVAIGLLSIGGMAIGLLAAAGGLGISGGLATGGAAIGTLANGGGAIGVVAQGGGAVGQWTRDGRDFGRSAPAIFEQLSWFFGAWPPTAISTLRPVLVVFTLALVVAGIIGLIAWRRIRSAAT